MLINKQKKTCHLVDFAVLADHRIKIKESEKIKRDLDLARELKETWNMKVTVIPIVVSRLGRVSEETRGIEDQKKDQNYTDHCIVNIN